MKNIGKKIYSGIYTKEIKQSTDKFLEDVMQSKADTDLIPYYLLETIAHNHMLAMQNITPKNEAKKILTSLLTYLQLSDEHKFSINPEIGDIHENVEYYLTKDIGEIAGWMHTARSRNDQVTTDQKLLTKKLFLDIFNELCSLNNILGLKSKQYSNTLMPGLTHLRVGMPSSFGFWWQSYLEQCIECQKILQSIFVIIDTNPLGAGASYGTNWKINPELTTKYLGFSQTFSNALTAINSRGIHEMYLLSTYCSLLTIFSRMMEDIVIFSMPEINWINLDEGYTSGSSIMPQKINPDIAEKIRSKIAKVLGLYVTTCVSLKSTPSGYNRDSAETKVAIIEASNEIIAIVKIAKLMLEKITPNKERMSMSISQSLATKLADTLVQIFQIPFRTAHTIVGISLAQSNKDINQITPNLLQKIIKENTGQTIPISQKMLDGILDTDTILQSFSYKGTPNPLFLDQNTKSLSKQNKKNYIWVNQEREKFYHAKQTLITQVKKYIQ